MLSRWGLYSRYHYLRILCLPCRARFGQNCRFLSSSSHSCKQNDFFRDLDREFVKFHNKLKESLPGSTWTPLQSTAHLAPERADIVIIGGGVIGWSIAYWLKQKERIRDGVKVLVVERDPTEHLGIVNEDPIDIQFNPSGYLFLADENRATILEENVQIQRSHGAKVALLGPQKLKKKFPWINTDGVALASYGLENEGWFDPWMLLNAFRRKALSMGVYQTHGDVAGFQFFTRDMVTSTGEPVTFKRIKVINVQTPNSLEYQPVECSLVVNAAGAWSGKVAEMATIGNGPPDTLAGIKVPVEPKKRYVYVFHCPGGPGLDCPLLIDNTGAYFRREGIGGNYIGGLSPTEEEEPDISDLEVDYDFFQQKLWPKLAQRVTAFESLKVKGGWAGYYDYNTFDQNAILGLHPLVHNMFLATGFSGHGLQQSPAVGRAIAELILDGSYQTLDLSTFSFHRICTGEQALERNVI
ncbi:FAD-dependent oxidoreductase domain-containing protein 1 isoform X2 [Rhinatrema bivittatum]|uniref:FAD-dependent oxidoreductase domain-containing protein 1 isoform X2 n=1 Tax=Rhinatrema bivittatum TaxID=194408 RepID=UPI0011277391|nr:FAD-dependent oxidoreductase domain-containing protein 1 isoform X2 [Rhinatrema bivittatum]